MLRGRKVLLAVTAGIAAYKSAELVRLLVRHGAEVRVLLTPNATKLVAPLVFSTLSGHPACWEQFRRGDEPESLPHLAYREWAEVLAVCPATANALGKFARGIADDLVSTTYLASSRIPVVLAPAMNPAMWAHPAVVENLAALRARPRHLVVGPDAGATACGDEGVGRLAPLDAIADGVRAALHAGGPDLAGRRFVITAGPTAEPVDTVRILTNRSSGRMGYALARAAAARGAEVVLIAGPVALPDPFGVRVVRVATALQLRHAALAELNRDTVFIGAAAVADLRPAEPAGTKLAKEALPAALPLVANPDIIAEVAAARTARAVVGFAAESGDPVPRAREKLARKGLDAIVANDVSRDDAGLESDYNLVAWITPDRAEPSTRVLKTDLAHWLLDRIAALPARP